ncbi:MAG: formyltransferase family protein, partial [Bdellovibrionota bacterium]
SASSVNFHPAYLPINRGWYPHVHSILDGSVCGVSIHKIDENADTGPIWAQEKVELLPTDTAKDIYVRLQKRIFEVFSKNWDSIKNGSLNPTPQNLTGGNYHKKNEIEALDHIDLEKTYTGEELINILRARSFGDRGFAYFTKANKKIFLKLELSEESRF